MDDLNIGAVLLWLLGVAVLIALVLFWSISIVGVLKIGLAWYKGV